MELEMNAQIIHSDVDLRLSSHKVWDFTSTCSLTVEQSLQQRPPCTYTASLPP